MNSSLRLASDKMPARMTEHLKGNRYTNTIYLCTSGMVKISCASRIPRDRKVYRGMSGLKLPKLFLVPGEDGGRGGDEFAFMSTSTKKNVAVRYEPVVCGGYGVVCRGQRRGMSLVTGVPRVDALSRCACVRGCVDVDLRHTKCKCD